MAAIWSSLYSITDATSPMKLIRCKRQMIFFFTTNLFQGGSKPYIILFHPLFIPSCIYKKDPCWLRKTKTSPTKPLPKSKHTYTQLSFACNMWSLYIYENILHMGDKLHVLLLYYFIPNIRIRSSSKKDTKYFVKTLFSASKHFDLRFLSSFYLVNAFFSWKGKQKTRLLLQSLLVFWRK